LTFSFVPNGLWKAYLVPERKPRSGTIFDFGLRILDSKKKAISDRLLFSSNTGRPYFKVFVQALRKKNEHRTPNIECRMTKNEEKGHTF